MIDNQKMQCYECGHVGLIISGQNMTSECYGFEPTFIQITDEEHIKLLEEGTFQEFLEHNNAEVLDENTTIDDINNLILDNKYNKSNVYIKKVIDGVNTYYMDNDVIVTDFTCPNCHSTITLVPEIKDENYE